MIGDRILQARKAAGLSMRALAERAGISAMAISKYESNKSTPSSGVMMALADALDVRVEYFFRTARVELKEIEYRKHSKLPKKVLDHIEGDVIEQVERYLELEEVLPVSPIGEFTLPDLDKLQDYDDIEHVAEKVREVWGLGKNPIPDLIDTLEEKGIKVFLSNSLHDEKFDGLAARVNGTPIVVLGKDWPGDRQRFTLAHELGHLVLSQLLDNGLDDEVAANRFAGAFLVPAQEVFKELGNKRNRLDPRELHILKMSYGLSMQGWLYRASDLGVLNKRASQDMWRVFNENKWRKKEPFERYPSEKPKLFCQLVLRAFAEDLITASKAAELLRISVNMLRAIGNMDICEYQAIN